MKKAAILIDAGFFMQRVHATHRKHFAEHELTAQCIMKVIWSMVLSHLNGKRQSQERREPLELYRIYFYDCPPLDIQTRLPLPEPGNKTPGRKNFKLEKSYILRTELHEELRKTRKTDCRNIIRCRFLLTTCFKPCRFGGIHFLKRLLRRNRDRNFNDRVIVLFWDCHVST